MTSLLLAVLHQFDRDAAADHRCRSLQARQRDVVLRIEEPVNLGAACLQRRCHLVLRDFFPLHRLSELPSHDLLDRLRLRLLKNASALRKSSTLEPMCFLLIAPTPSCASAPAPLRSQQILTYRLSFVFRQLLQPFRYWLASS